MGKYDDVSELSSPNKLATQSWDPLSILIGIPRKMRLSNLSRR